MLIVQPICYDCKHFDRDTLTCAAFPIEIPKKIFLGDNNHSKPLKGQGNKIVFEPKESTMTKEESLDIDFSKVDKPKEHKNNYLKERIEEYKRKNKQ